MGHKPNRSTLYGIAEPLCRHEAAHLVVAKALGFRTGDITMRIIDLFGGHAGQSSVTLMPKLCSLEHVVEYLEARIKILFAGALGQSLKEGRIDNEYAIKCIREQGGQHDYGKAKELIHVLRAVRFPEDKTEDEVQGHLNEIDLDLWNRAATIVEQENAIISGLGSRLASEIIELGKPFALTASQIASLPALKTRFGGDP